MALDFPTSPSPDQVHTSGSRSWTWNNTSGAWLAVNAGVQGAQGVTGSQGTQGTQGLQGITGANGSNGSQGTQGIQGLQGITGSQGTQGIQGIQGTAGFVGSNGAQGTQGAQGIQGITGAQGITGSQGITGAQGTQGIQGIQGIQGRQGIQGITGTTGTQGTVGTTGAQGITGTTGTQGAVGSQGTIGTSVTGAQGTVGAQGTSGAATALPLAGGTMTGNIARSDHHYGHLVGGYNNVGANDTKTNPIYSIGSGYLPSATSRAGWYGCGYSHANSGFFPSGATGWGFYVVEAGSTLASISSNGIAVNGVVTATGNITAYYSDDRLKTRLGPIDNALNKVLSLNGFYFEANETAQALGYAKKKEVGVSAQEVELILPEIIAPAPIDSKYKTLDYAKLVPLLIEAIKTLNAKVDSLQTQLNNK